MDQRKRTLFSLAVILLIFAALLIGFGRVLFNTNTPDVALPYLGGTEPDSSGTPGQSDSDSQQLVTVTTQTVQSVIATLDRADSYYREMTIEQFWSGTGSGSTVQTWVDRDWTLVRQLLPSNAVRQDLIGPETGYYWYEGSAEYLTAPAARHAADLAQRIPTYETVLELDPSAIVSADYALKGDIPCIYVQSVDDVSGSVRHFWVSVDSGLLVSAELYREEALVYRMTALSPIQSPCPPSAAFRLPDGTILHEP